MSVSQRDFVVLWCAEVSPHRSRHMNKDQLAAGLLPLICGFHSDESESA